MPAFSEFQEALDHIINQLTTARGEALCARTLALYALHGILSASSDTKGNFEKLVVGGKKSIEAAIPDTEADDVLVEKQIAHALQRFEESTEELSRLLGLRPGTTH